jgi:hypothetical protein
MDESSAAKQAFDRGDFALARRLARGTADEKDIFARTGFDPLIIQIALACVAFYALVIAFNHGS